MKKNYLDKNMLFLKALMNIIQASGDPAPEIEWKRNGMVLAQHANQKYLHLREATTNDAAT